MAIADYTNNLDVDSEVEADFNFTKDDGTLETVGAGFFSENTARRWCLGIGSTPSSGTGPSANPSGRSGYAYTESSSSTIPSYWAMKRNDSFDTTTVELAIDLKYNLNINVGSVFYIEYATVASPNETTDWTILETISGTATDLWIDDTFEFTGVSSATTWVRIRCNYVATNFRNDLAFSTWREYEAAEPLNEDQEGFRFRNDDGSESAATWKAGQDTDITLPASTKARLRVVIDTDTGTGSNTFTLQYKRTDEATDEWRNI